MLPVISNDAANCSHDSDRRRENMPGRRNMSESRIRVARKEDAEALLEIYAYYVEKTAITFEYAVPTVQEFERRMQHVLEKYPYLVAGRNGEIVGYAYAGAFKERAAYDWAVETTVYVRNGLQKTGIGRALYEALEELLALQNIQNLNACIAYLETEDEFLTHNSVQFHEHMGYRLVGEFDRCGYKNGRWYNMVWMEKHIGRHETEPPAVRPFSEVRQSRLPCFLMEPDKRSCKAKIF